MAKRRSTRSTNASQTGEEMFGNILKVLFNSPMPVKLHAAYLNQIPLVEEQPDAAALEAGLIHA